MSLPPVTEGLLERGNFPFDLEQREAMLIRIRFHETNTTGIPRYARDYRLKVALGVLDGWRQFYKFVGE